VEDAIKAMLVKVAQAARSGNAEEEQAAIRRNTKQIVEGIREVFKVAYQHGVDTTVGLAEQAEREQESNHASFVKALTERLGLQPHPLDRWLEDLDPELRSLFENPSPEEEH
jgi:hypothetical protein